MGHCRPKPAAPGEGRVLAGFAEILFTLITRIRVLVYADRGRQNFSLFKRALGYHCAEVRECWDGSQDFQTASPGVSSPLQCLAV